MAENIGILIVFFILLIFGLIFYVGIQKTTYQSRSEEASQLQTISVSQKALYLPEFACTKGFNVIEDHCFDKAKLNAFVDFANNNKNLINTLYYDYFKESKIHIQELLPGNDEWTVYNRTNPDLSMYSTQLPISLYDPAKEEYSFAILYADVYAK